MSKLNDVNFMKVIENLMNEYLLNQIEDIIKKNLKTKLIKNSPNVNSDSNENSESDSNLESILNVECEKVENISDKKTEEDSKISEETFRKIILIFEILIEKLMEEIEKQIKGFLNENRYESLRKLLKKFITKKSILSILNKYFDKNSFEKKIFHFIIESRLHIYSLKFLILSINETKLTKNQNYKNLFKNNLLYILDKIYQTFESINKCQYKIKEFQKIINEEIKKNFWKFVQKNEMKKIFLICQKYKENIFFFGEFNSEEFFNDMKINKKTIISFNLNLTKNTYKVDRPLNQKTILDCLNEENKSGENHKKPIFETKKIKTDFRMNDCIKHECFKNQNLNLQKQYCKQEGKSIY